MPFIPAVGVCQAELIYAWDTQIVQNVLHFEPDTALTPELMLELGPHLVTWWNTSLKGSSPTNLQLSSIKLTDLTTQTAPSFVYSTGLPLTGTGGSPSLPNNCALVITKRTVFRGRSFRGRIFHPGLYESIVTGNTVDAGAVSSFVSAWSQLRTFTTTGASWNMVVISRQADLVPRETALITEVLSLSSDGVVDSQRRRLPRRGA